MAVMPGLAGQQQFGFYSSDVILFSCSAHLANEDMLPFLLNKLHTVPACSAPLWPGPHSLPLLRVPLSILLLVN